MSATHKDAQHTVCVFASSVKPPILTPFYLLNYFAKFYEICIFYALHISGAQDIHFQFSSYFFLNSHCLKGAQDYIHKVSCVHIVITIG